MASEKKKLDVNVLKEIDETYNEMQEITVGDYTLNIQKKFRPSQIQEMMGEIGATLSIINEKELDVDNLSIASLFILKYFTDLDIPDDLEKSLRILSILIDSELLPQIIVQFDTKELEKIADYLNQATKEIQSRLEIMNTQRAVLEAKESQETSEDKGEQLP